MHYSEKDFPKDLTKKKTWSKSGKKHKLSTYIYNEE